MLRTLVHITLLERGGAPSLDGVLVHLSRTLGPADAAFTRAWASPQRAARCWRCPQRWLTATSSGRSMKHCRQTARPAAEIREVLARAGQPSRPGPARVGRREAELRR